VSRSSGSDTGHGTPRSGTTARREPKADIVDTAVAAGSFKTLAKALTEAGLVETLKGKGPFTVDIETGNGVIHVIDKVILPK